MCRTVAMRIRSSACRTSTGDQDELLGSGQKVVNAGAGLLCVGFGLTDWCSAGHGMGFVNVEKGWVGWAWARRHGKSQA